MRIEKIRQALRARGLDAIILSDSKNRHYATGFRSSAGAVYISEKQAVFYTDFRYIEAARASVKDVEVRQIETGCSYSKVIEPLIETDNAHTVALEDDCLTFADYTSWSKSLKAEVVPQKGLMEELRAIKTQDELENIIAAQRIAETALEEILNDIRPSVTEREIAARLTYLMLHHGAENMSFDPIVVSGTNSSKPHGVPSDKPIEVGDFVTMDFGCIYNGYCSDMTRTIAVGTATDEMCHVYETVLKAQLAGMEIAKAGVTGREVDGAARKIISDAGFGDYFGHGFGHGVGLLIHEAPTVSFRNDKPLPAGAVVTAEPGIYLPGKFGVRIEDMLYLTEEGNQVLTLAPKNLLIL